MKKQHEKNLKNKNDFSKGVRGKYYKKYMQGTNIVVLDPKISKIFPDSASVNEALIILIKVGTKVKKFA